MTYTILIIDLIALGGLAAAGWVVVHLAHQQARFSRRIERLEHPPASGDGMDRAGHEVAPGIRRTYGDPISSSPIAPRIGFPAPPFELPDRTGTPVRLADFRGQRTFVLFWSPTCSHCMDIINDLRAWQANGIGSSSVRLVIVSTGPEAMPDQLRLDATVLLDAQSETRQAFGAVGTPSAVIVDEHGNVASTLARGGPAILALLRRAPHIHPNPPSARLAGQTLPG